MSFLKELARIFNIEIKDNATNAEIDDLLKDIPTVAEQIALATKTSEDNLATTLGEIAGYKDQVTNLTTEMGTLKADVLAEAQEAISAAIETANTNFDLQSKAIAKEVNAVKLLKQGGSGKIADPVLDEGEEDDNKAKDKTVVKGDFLDKWLGGTIVN